MMMIASNYLVRQKEWAHGEEEEEEARGRRKGGPTGTPTPGADGPTGSTRSGCQMLRTGENKDSGVGFQSTERAEWARD